MEKLRFSTLSTAWIPLNNPRVVVYLDQDIDIYNYYYPIGGVWGGLKTFEAKNGFYVELALEGYVNNEAGRFNFSCAGVENSAWGCGKLSRKTLALLFWRALDRRCCYEK